ncbi:MAG: ABC transporter ATP-binding protein [Pseudomonadota bacterium]
MNDIAFPLAKRTWRQSGAVAALDTRPGTEDSGVPPTLRVNGLTTSFLSEGQWRPVVREVSFELAPGETLAIVGESGSGKSVSALSIMRLLDTRHARIGGSIRLGDRELLTLDAAAMNEVRGKEIAMIFQEPMTSLNPVLTVGKQLAETLVVHRGLDWKAARLEAIRQLDRMRIPAAAARYDEYPHRLSGGMRQRVMIAIALACKPKLLIADEPTTALDVTIQAEILDLIKELQAEDETSVLFITHDMGVVAELADRTLVMYQGQNVEAGPTTEIFERPAHPYTRTLLNAVPRLGSMSGQPRPRPFAQVDPATGRVSESPELPDAVDRGDIALLEVSNLTTRFDLRSGLLGRVTRRVHAVEDVSFSMRAGETLALVGESGSGKSTVGRSLLGLVKAQAGSVKVDGRDVLALRGSTLRDHRRSLQMIFQDPFGSLDPRQTIGSALAEPLLAHGLAQRDELAARIDQLLVQVGLEAGMASRYPHEFSGGQRQRISIARALALKPRMIVADEAVSALDVSIKAQVINLMMALQAKHGLAWLFISHDLSVVERISHRVAVMHLGQIVEIGPREAIFDDARHPYTRKLLSAVPVPDPRRRHQRHGLPNCAARCMPSAMWPRRAPCGKSRPSTGCASSPWPRSPPQPRLCGERAWTCGFIRFLKRVRSPEWPSWVVRCVNRPL